MRSLSVIITTFNEEHNIEGVLESIRWADDILIVDSFSTDRTLDLARKFQVRILQRAYQGPADQKNWAIPQARNEWILLLDADERVTTALKKEVQQILGQPEVLFDAFWIGRQNFFMGRKVRFSGWQGDAVIRLFRRDLCRYNDQQVHEEIIAQGIRVGRLKNKMEHYTFKDTGHFLDKMRRYARWSAQDHFDRTRRVTFFHLYFKPLLRFLKHYVWQGGFLDGQVGFIISRIMAWGVFLRYLYLKEEGK
jgi:glycosyltransferase involved in cell wall biosynthesis